MKRRYTGISDILRAYRDSADSYTDIEMMILDMRCDYYLPLIPRWRLAKFCTMARDRAARLA
jgi:hypothetical protein